MVGLAAGVPCVLSVALYGRLPLWGTIPVSVLGWLVAVSATLFRSQAWLGFLPGPAAVRAALLGVRDAITYEGQAAIELERLADPAERGGYPAAVSRDGGVLVVAGSDLVRAAMADLAAGVGVPVISARFHNGVSDLIVRCCRMLRDGTGLTTVALSGGVFQNVLLLRRTVDRLGGAGFRVLTHSGVPANDGGISLGQVAVAAARDRLGPVSP
ncbi:Kae1-like domain-containing protein [Nonomuraea sp. NPDC003201]